MKQSIKQLIGIIFGIIIFLLLISAYFIVGLQESSILIKILSGVGGTSSVVGLIFAIKMLINQIRDIKRGE